MDLFEGWEEHATERQIEILDAWKEYGSASQAAKALGLDKSTIVKAKTSVLEKAARHRLTDEDLALKASPGFGFKRKSLYFNTEKGVTGGWLIQEPDKIQQEAMAREFIEGLAESIRGMARPTKPPVLTTQADDYLTTYVLGDAHLGLYAWGEETGDGDYDSDIAKRHIMTAVDYLVSAAPVSREGILIDVGDLMHMDDTTNRTFKGKNQLDVDTRFARVMRIAAFVMQYCVEAMLKKHEIVRVVNVRGNHNPHSSTAVNMALRMMYEREPRVIIHSNTQFFQYHVFGNNLIGMTHGDTAKPEKLPGIMAEDQDENWGKCKNRYWIRGHIHHNERKEFGSCAVESFNTLTARDSWHTEQGYRAKRSMHMLGIHRKHGIMPRVECPLSLVEEICDAA